MTYSTHDRSTVCLKSWVLGDRINESQFMQSGRLGQIISDRRLSTYTRMPLYVFVVSASDTIPPLKMRGVYQISYPSHSF